MIVKVTMKHIKNGKKHDCRYCPIGLALKDAGINTMDKEHWVSKGFAMWLKNGVSRKFEDFSSKFDFGIPVKPFSFRVRKPK